MRETSVRAGVCVCACLTSDRVEVCGAGYETAGANGNRATQFAPDFFGMQFMFVVMLMYVFLADFGTP